MGKITKSMQPKHKETLSPWLKGYVESASTTPLPLLPKHLAAFPSRWPFPRGDLYHWIPLLNRFDSILEHFCVTYKLNEGPQERAFACDVLIDHVHPAYFADGKDWDAAKIKELGFSSEGDRQLIESILKFSRMLLEHCGNRSIYASSSHLNDLLNSTSLPILIATMEVGSELAQRYQASVKRIGTASRQISAALLGNHYNIDLERVQQLALPFTKTPIVSLADSHSFASLGSASKGKEKAQTSSRNAAPTHANDLVAIAIGDDKRWAGWGDVRVSYYPQENVSNTEAPANPGASSVPSTPTPLRRSSTMNTHSTPRARHAPVDDSSPLEPRTPAFPEESAAGSGQKWVEIPQSVVASTPLYNLVDRCPKDMPATSKYEFFHRLRVAKALSDSKETRQQLLALRLLAITNLAYIHTESNFVEKVLRHDMDETRRYQLVYQLAEMIHPSADGTADVPLWLQTIALALLAAVSSFMARCQDVLSALNANVNHGILLYVIRKAVAGMSEDDPSDDGGQATEADEWRNHLFALTLHLSTATRVGSEMVSAGLMEILVEMLNLRSKIAQRHHATVLGFLDGLVWNYSSPLTAFFNANGLDAMAKLVVDTLEEARSLRSAGRGTPRSQQTHAVDYEIPYYQQQTLKWLLKFIHHIMSNSFSYTGNTDRLLRNLAEKSDLLGGLREIIGNKKIYGSVIWTNSVTILSDFINNDPTSFAAISESGMIKTYLEAITGTPLPEEDAQRDVGDEDGNDSDTSDSSIGSSFVVADDRPHPPPEEELRSRDRESLAAGILASPDAMLVVPSVLNSISLNNAGMRMIVKSRVLDSFFEIFESAEHVRCMAADENLASNLGASFDELARHHPSLRSSITNAVVDMIARVKYLGLFKSETAGWGVKLLLPASKEKKGPDATAQEASHGTTGDEDVDMSDAVQSQDAEADTAAEGRHGSPTSSITPYIYAMASFLSSYLNTVPLKTILVDNGAIELLLDICESPSLPASFGDSAASRMLNSVVVTLLDHCPIRGLPSLLRRAQLALDALQPLAAKKEALPPYFAPFLAPETQGGHIDLAPEAIAEANSLVKALLNAQTFIKIASEGFNRSRSAMNFHPVNVYDYYLNLINSIGPVLRGVLAEEAGQLTVVPQHWSFRHHPAALDGGSSSQANPTAEADDGPLPDVLNPAGEWKEDGEKTVPIPSRPSKQEKDSPRFQNYETLRTLLHPMIPTTFPLFQALGKVLLPRREINQGDPYFKCRHLEIAKALADTVLSHLGSSVDSPNPTSKDFHYWIIMLHTIHEMLIHHPRPNDRTTLQVLLPVLLAFKELGGLTVLNQMVKVFAQTVKTGSQNSPEESSKSKVAAFGLKKILDLYFILANGKHIGDANGLYHIQRQMDRNHQATHIGNQIVLEIRGAIFPAVASLWDTNVIEKIPDQTVKRLIATLKMICVAESETETIPKDKRVFSLFRYTDARFNWATVRGVVEDLMEAEYPEDLVLEAVYRANGNGATAREYCRAHKAGKAGPHRHRIPPQDANTSALKEPAAPGSGRDTPSAADTTDADRMSVDGLADVPGETTGQPVTQAAEDGPEGITTYTRGGFLMSVKHDLDVKRAEIRTDLIDQCLDVIRIHPDTAIEVSDLIKDVMFQQSDPEQQEEVCTTLTYALSSLSLDDEDKKKNAKCIASYAHLLALLLQDAQFFDQNIDTLRDRVDDYLSFLNAANSKAFDTEPPSWTPYILLILETLLRHDERPVPIKWKPPTSLDEEVAAPPVLTMRDSLVSDAQCEEIFTNLSTMLCTAGTDELRATAILRVLVILTRRRQLAQLAGKRLHLSRLCLTARQFSRLGSERMKSARISSHIMTILRHIVEDDEIIKQIMRAEIKTDFTSLLRTHRQPDVNIYLRAMSHLALRSPVLFVEVTNELLRFSRWNPTPDIVRGPFLTWKEEATSKTEPAQPIEEPAAQSIKESTEAPDKQMTDVSKQDAKRPVVESPDGVIHFLLTELVAFREVEDKEPPKESHEEGEQSVAGRTTSSSTEDVATEGKDKKSQKPVFKTEDHPIYVYRCFLLTCLAELLQSYTRSKVEFINFKRSAPPASANTPVKPRSSVLNYLIYDLLCQGNLSGTADTIASKKKAATASHAQKLLVALVSRTNERTIDRTQDKYTYEDEPDLLFVRKFVLDTVLKAYERAPLSDEPLETRYSRMQCLAELMNMMVGEKDKDQNTGSRSQEGIQARSQAQIRRLMYEKGYLDKLTSSIAEINLSYPGVKRAIKYILRVLRVLTDTAKELSHANILPSESLGDDEDDYGSSSSLSDLDDAREETPDLYRNSTLGMLEPRGEDDESEDESGDDDDEDMYGDDMYEEGYEEDMEVDYDDGPDSEDDEVLNEIGEIEGLPGDHTGLIEVDLDPGDDDDDDDEDDEDDDEDSDEDDDDDMDSADMDDMDDEVEIVDEDGNPVTDDGNSAWTSESDGDDEGDPEGIDVDYEAEVQDEEEAHMHRLNMNMEATEVLLNSMAHVLDDGFEEHMMDEREETYEAGGGLDEGEEDEEEEMEDEEYIYPDANGLIDEQGPQIPALGWDYMGTEDDNGRRQIWMLDAHRRHGLSRGDSRSPFPTRFPSGRDHLSNFRSFLNRTHRHSSANFEDGTNPLLRREQSSDTPSRHGHTHTFGLRLPDGIGMFPGPTRHGGDGSLSFLHDLFEFLPMMGRPGQPLHFHVTGPGGSRELRDIGAPRVSRNEQRREGWMQEPYHAVSFHVDSTMNRYQEEMRLVFGSNHSTEAARIANAILARLMPAAIELEKEARAADAAAQKRLEEARQKRDEEERLLREAKEAEEKAAREKKEAEDREAAERAAAEAAATSNDSQNQTEPGQPSNDSAMEGVESTDRPAAAAASEDQTNSGAPSNEPRVMTVIRGEEVDITELGIDPDYLAALPEEFREEVIAQTISSRRIQAREEAATGESTEVFQEFLDALPDELRLEIVQQERQEQRRRAREDNRRQVLAAASTRAEPTAAEMDDPASILLTFPPELREQVLMDQGQDLMDQLPPELAAQARALAQQHAPQRRHIIRALPPTNDPAGLARPATPPSGAEHKSHRRAVIQMLDKAGVATLLRLMFIAQQGSIRSYLFNVFTDVCENRQTRLEVVSSILQILQDGSTDMPAVERSFGQLSLKAKKHKDKETEQKTPQSLKRTLTTLTAPGSTSANSETSPLLIVQQCLDLLVELCGKNPHISWLFLTEHETVGSTLKRSLSRKGKSKDTRAHKFAINSLLALLDRELVIESSIVMTHLADLLNRVTLPLQNLDRRRKEAEEASKSEEKPNEAEAASSAAAPEQASGSQVPNQNSGESTEAKEQKKDEAPQKKPRQLQPPVIPPANLTLVVRIFVARECSSKTFQNTISTIKNLSAIPGAKAIFGQELVRQAQLLSENILLDLDSLLPHIEKATSGTEIQGIALSKFSPGASEQNKLLRVLTALDHLFDEKRNKNTESEGTNEGMESEKQNLVTSLYHNSTFSTMWDKLSACLKAIRQRESMLNVATILLPLIESLMVVCKNMTITDDQSQSQVGKEMLLSSPPPETRTASLFFSFTEDHRRILNELVRHNPKLMSGTFALLVKNPKVLEFDNKRNYFNRSVHSRQNQNRQNFPPLQLSVRRDHVFHDSFRHLFYKSGDEIKYGKLNIRFHGEEGVDAGGVTREWFQVLSRQMFDPNYALFIPVSSDRTTFHPNKLSGINDEHLLFFKFIGRIIGKALYEGRVLDCFFSRAVYKRILGKTVSVKDMESFDPDYYKSLCWMLDNDITDIITETFSVEDDEFGVTNVVDLIPNGRDIPVTDENKHDYVRLVVEHKLLASVKEQMEHFLKGFHEIIPAELISIFDEQELELLISGLPDIDVDDWKSNTEYHNYSLSSPQIQWFWRAVRSFDKEERAKLLQFVTGTSKVPLNGFKELEGMNGVNRFNIHRDYGNKDRLPTSHTCFNQLDIPEYDSYDILRSQIMKAITAGSDYFGFA